jgi:hypothetical protein
LPNCGRPEGRPFQSAILSSHNFSSANNFSLATVFLSPTIFSLAQLWSNAHFFKTHFFKPFHFFETHFSQDAFFSKRRFSQSAIFFKAHFKGPFYKAALFHSGLSRAKLRSNSSEVPLTMSGYGPNPESTDRTES